MNPDSYLIAEDIYSIHVNHIKIKIEDRAESDAQIYLYSDDIELEVKDWEKVGSDFIIKYDHPDISGAIRTDFINKIESKMNAEFRKGDTIKIRASQYNDNDRQKVFSGIKRFVIDKGSSIDIYIAPSPYVELS